MHVSDEKTRLYVATQKGLERGRSEGIAENSREIAIKLLKDRMPTEKVSKITNLPIDQIKELSASLEK